MKFPDDAELKKEWKTLPHHPSPRCGGARKFFFSALNNPGKNRYPDVLPFERTLVRLHSGDHCTYINANFIQTVPQQRPRYIACQAPLPHTFTDFWVMIWENDTPVIVMLTRLMERRRVKAHCYWPSREGEEERFGDIYVVLKQEVIQEKLTFRLFNLKRGDEVREVLHIHYQEWPDYGAPLSCSIIGRVISAMSSYRDAHQKKFHLTEPPLVTVHCSAGIGRAGTFIAINAYRERKEANLYDASGTISVKDIVEDLRQQRMGMVQSKEQYYFIYRAIQDFEGVADTRSFLPPVSSRSLAGSVTSVPASCAFSLSATSPALPNVVAVLQENAMHSDAELASASRRNLRASSPNLSLSSSSSNIFIGSSMCNGTVMDEETYSSDDDDYMVDIDDDEDVGVISFSTADAGNRAHHEAHSRSPQQFRSMSYSMGLNVNIFTGGMHSPLPTVV